MKIAIYTMYFPPDFGSAPILMNEFATFLTQRGHRVSVITTIPRARGKFKFSWKPWITEQRSGFTTIRIWTNSTPQPMGRFVAWVIYTVGATLVSTLVKEKADVLFMRTPPPTLGLTAALLRRLRRSKIILNVQDIHPDLAIESGILKNPVAMRVALAFEKWVYAQASSIVVISEGFRKNLQGKGVPPGKIHVIPNWVDVDFIRPHPKDNHVSRQLGLDAKFVVMYSGTITTSSLLSLEKVLQVASLLREDNDILFAIVGEGIYKENLQQQAERLQLANVVFIPFRPQDELPYLLSSADVALVPLDTTKSQLSVPSKLYHLMSAGRPVLGLARQDTEVAKVISEVQCGVVVDPDNEQAIADAILDLKRSPQFRERLGSNGRTEVEKNYSQETILKKYEDLMNSK